MTETEYTTKLPDALSPGFRFDEFEIQHVIESTSTSVVYKAWDHQLERLVSIREYMPRALTVRRDDMKLALSNKLDNQAFSTGMNQFIQEARLLAQFNHPNLLQVYRVWVENDTAYTASPWFNGVTLAELHQHQPEIINETWIRRMLSMLCGALAALHERGFIHRDLSLKTIQIQENGAPLLLSVGSIRSTTPQIHPEHSVALNPGFAPLEQYAKDLENQLGPWTDIYALGAILYTLITGTCPPASVTRSIQDPCVTLAKSRPDGYSTSLLHAVDCALALKPEARPQSIADFAALADIPVGGVPDVVSQKPQGTMLVAVENQEISALFPFWKRHKSALQIAASLLVGVVAGGAIFGKGFPDSLHTLAAHAENTVTQAKVTPEAPKSALPPEEAMLARIYIRMNEGEQLDVNGKRQTIATGANGYGLLQLPAGKYQITLNDEHQTRGITLSVENGGTWLVNPQG